MAEVGGWALVMAIQAVQSEIIRLRRLEEDAVVSGDELLLVDFERAAEELEAAYAEAVRLQPNLPPYPQLVNRRGPGRF
ncbi:hypothetical protein [Aliiruegeria sabulilitoris]|uniref:hypothetical protein n=1 Tax=Aliiruegeria sabulilitoris TaxID=1510458 RepID=UPI000833E235|nr:hypothetical protein [Aliiruegeria sabulilitoris]NDR57096.1 hypothetical protein [Pseudoruegeria sp. M32A2M]